MAARDQSIRSASRKRFSNSCRVPAAGEPGGWSGTVYYRLHGSPRVYYSAYDEAHLRALAMRLGGGRWRRRSCLVHLRQHGSGGGDQQCADAPRPPPGLTSALRATDPRSWLFRLGCRSPTPDHPPPPPPAVSLSNHSPYGVFFTRYRL
jgi:hypothetical protein